MMLFSKKILLLTALIVVLSFLPNSFAQTFSDISIKNGIDRSRGQSMDAGWPPALGRLLFNKSAYLTFGILNWLDNISPAYFFRRASKIWVKN